MNAAAIVSDIVFSALIVFSFSLACLCADGFCSFGGCNLDTTGHGLKYRIGLVTVWIYVSSSLAACAPEIWRRILGSSCVSSEDCVVPFPFRFLLSH